MQDATADNALIISVSGPISGEKGTFKSHSRRSAGFLTRGGHFSGRLPASSVEIPSSSQAKLFGIYMAPVKRCQASSLIAT